MAQSIFIINGYTYNLDLQSYSDTNIPNLTEVATMIDPSDTYSRNSVLIATGYKRHTFFINGQCDVGESGIYTNALEFNYKVYPYIYATGSSTNVVTDETNAYYYFKSFSRNLILGSALCYYSAALVYGGVY